MQNQIIGETTDATDAELVRRAKAGGLDAFETLANRHEQRVYSLALRMLRHEQDAEDVTQQAFLSAVEESGSATAESPSKSGSSAPCTGMPTKKSTSSPRSRAA